MDIERILKTVWVRVCVRFFFFFVGWGEISFGLRIFLCKLVMDKGAVFTDRTIWLLGEINIFLINYGRSKVFV